MALEAILQMKTDNKSDVWAFGVVLWEIGTLGKIYLLPKSLDSVFSLDLKGKIINGMMFHS